MENQSQEQPEPVVITEEEAKRIHKRAIQSASSKGFYRDAEDFAQNILLKFLEGKGKGQTIDQAVIDEIRSKYGQSRYKNKVGKRGRAYTPRKADPVFVSTDELIEEAEEPNFGEDLDVFTNKLRSVPPLERGVFVMVCVLGYSVAEVAQIFVVSPMMASHMVTRAALRMNGTNKKVDSIKKPVKPKLKRETKKREPEMPAPNRTVKSYHHKLTEAQIAEMHAMKANGIRQKEIAAKFNISQATVSLTLNGRINVRKNANGTNTHVDGDIGQSA